MAQVQILAAPFKVDEEKKIGITVKKEENFSEWFTQICSERGAQLADLRYNVQGFIVHRPWAMRILRKIYSMFEKEVEADCHEPVLFPTVIREENLNKEAQHAGFTPEVFWLEKVKGEDRLALRPTSETAFYQMYSLWIRSHRDLPLKIYQRANIFRYETKATRPLIRAREFYWIESHDAFATKEEAESQVREDMEITENVMHKQYAIPFLFFKRPAHDKFPGSVYTYAADSLMPDGRVIQLPSTH